MPTSWSLFDLAAAQIITAAQPTAALDVGAGMGKYGTMLKSIRGAQCRRVAYEKEEAYVKRFKLTEIYDEVRLHDIYDHMGTHEGINERWSMVIFGDVLEHMYKSEAVDLIHFFLYRCEYIMIVVPYGYIQNDAGGVLSEAHVSNWHPSEFVQFTDVAAIDADPPVASLILLRGFMCHRTEFDKTIAGVPAFGQVSPHP